MKRTTILILFFITVFTVNYAHAQTALGIRVGGNASLIDGAVPIYTGGLRVTGVDPVLKAGFQFGLMLEHEFSHAFAMQTGAVFNVIGSRFDIRSIGDMTNTAAWNISYLQMPLDLVVNLGWFSIHAGGYFGYALVANAQYDFRRQRMDLLDTIGGGGWNMQHIDFGVRGGIGLRFGNSQFAITYSFGLANLFNPSDFQGIIQNHSAIEATNHVISITATHFFRRD